MDQIIGNLSSADQPLLGPTTLMMGELKIARITFSLEADRSQIVRHGVTPRKIPQECAKYLQQSGPFVGKCEEKDER
jgi:hypothetical protein